MAEYCAQHASDGMVDVCKKKCRTKSCGKIPSFGAVGAKTAEYCAQHALDGLFSVSGRNCKIECCGKRQSVGVAGTKIANYCAQHAPDRMTGVKLRKCIVKKGKRGACRQKAATVLPNRTATTYCICPSLSFFEFDIVRYGGTS